MGQWTIKGHDTFADEWYPLESGLANEQEAQAAARKHLAEIERLQPQNGIQDKVYIVGPDGIHVRFFG
jgi:hypothetical protein